MSKKKLMVLIFIISIIFSTYFYNKHQEALSKRHTLLCEVLKAGMSKIEVLDILKKYGDFTLIDTNPSEKGLNEIYISFTNQKNIYIDGNFSLLFENNRYFMAHKRLTSDTSELICSFSLTP